MYRFPRRHVLDVNSPFLGYVVSRITGMFPKILCFLCVALAAARERKIAKRSDIDLQTCIENFDVHKDKIIRTQDSRDMGAKYINEMDLGSREECLRLCCETENCDVFVFEEKNTGSCYLFQCGPPEDFKCKFTHHANYSSAILAVNRHVPDLESQIKLTKHEQDLTKLKKPEAVTEAITQRSPEATTTTPTTTTEKVVAAPTSPPRPREKCRRYQFECRTSKECIAIYNACDGIPQCADGSDEAAELGCPEPLPTQSANRPPQNLYDEAIANQNRPSESQLNQVPPKIYQTPVQQEMAPQDFLKPPDVHNVGFVPHAPQYEGPRLASYQQIPSQNQNGWVVHQPNQIPLQYQQYDDRNSHIFNHKENGLQVSEGQELRYNKHRGAMQTLHRALGYSSAGQVPFNDVNVHNSPKINNYFDNTYHQSPVYQEKWPKNAENHPNNPNQYPSADTQNNMENWPSNSQVAEEENPLHHPNHAPSNQPPPWKPPKQTDSHEHENIAHELKHSKELMENADKKEKKIKIEKIQTHDTHDNVQYAKMTQYKLTQVLDLQDGIAETPGGAVLSLTLGLIITCVMALLIGCRLRVVRRRMRRGGKSYAHDADYLVNGMYL